LEILGCAGILMEIYWDNKGLFWDILACSGIIMGLIEIIPNYDGICKYIYILYLYMYMGTYWDFMDQTYNGL